MSASASRSEAEQTNTQITTQTDNRIGASEGAIVADDGSTINIQSMDFQTVATALGLSEEVVQRMAQLAGRTVDSMGDLSESTVGEMGDVSRHSMDTVLEALQTVATNSERTTAEMSLVYDRFGQDLSSLKIAEMTGGASESNKLITYIIWAGALLGIVLIWRRK